MQNRDIYQRDPSTRKLVNEGVANVNDDQSSKALEVLRYELETFVCDGQYAKGMAHILETFLKNINQVQQPAVWVSGFYGSGKSHLVKMLRALWMDSTFGDGAKARGITTLPQNIMDSFKELSIQAKRHGGLHAASGTLGAGASGSVRLALLRVVFKSKGLPEQYPVARFVMWLKSEGIYEQVREIVESNDFDWDEELDNFYVAEGLHEALVQVKPNLFSSTVSCVETLNNLYPYVQDISSDDMLKAIQQSLTIEGKFPLTLIVLDEVQQYIGEDSQRSIDVQEVVEACSKNIGGKLLFIGTGQTAVTGTSNLKKLEGRFTIRVELSDADVDAVIRKVILAKKPEVKAPIEEIMQTNLGEISRQLSSTTIGHKQTDISFYPQDYPILPIRRRFWENSLRVLDQTGTDSQLRNQLSMIHKVIQTNLDKPLGSVVPGDYLYFDSAEKLLQARILPRKVHEKTVTWGNGSDDERLMSRACGLVFLINKLSGSNNDIGIKSTIDVIADLLVEDLAQGSAGLRSKLPTLLDSCELLMKVGDEYRIQTEESASWTDEFLTQRSILANESHRIDAERDDRIRSKFKDLVKRLTLSQGDSKVTREIFPIFDSSLPTDFESNVYLWIRDGWSINENSVRADARQAGNKSPTIFIYIPKRSSDDIRHNLIEYKAAYAALEIKGFPNTPEGIEARAAMDTTRQTALGKINELLNEAFSGSRVFQSGGNEILGNELQEMVLEAANNSLTRLYPQFHTADHTGWSKVYDNGRKGAPDALKAVGYDGEPRNNPVCKAVLGYIAGSKKGLDIRINFESSPFGWSRDAVDGAIQMLLISGLIRSEDDRGKVIDPREIERKSISKIIYKVESATVTTQQRIKIRQLYQKVGISIHQGEELGHANEFLSRMLSLAEQAGGDAPRPKKPETRILEDIRLTTGNEQLLLIFNSQDILSKKIKQWSELKTSIVDRIISWDLLSNFSGHLNGIEGAEVLTSQINTISTQRQLLDTPDLINPLLSNVTQLLREELNSIKKQWDQLWAKGEATLEADDNWQQLEPEQRHQLRVQETLISNSVPIFEVENTESILKSLTNNSLPALRDRIAAMPSRYGNILLKAAKLCEPQAQFIVLPRVTIKNENEIDTWIEEVRSKLLKALEEGPIIIS